jgi:hypothetical protein
VSPFVLSSWDLKEESNRRHTREDKATKHTIPNTPPINAMLWSYCSDPQLTDSLFLSFFGRESQLNKFPDKISRSAYLPREVGTSPDRRFTFNLKLCWEPTSHPSVAFTNSLYKGFVILKRAEWYLKPPPVISPVSLLWERSKWGIVFSINHKGISPLRWLWDKVKLNKEDSEEALPIFPSKPFPARFRILRLDMDQTQCGMRPLMLRTRVTEVKGKGRGTICWQPFADPKPSIEITWALVASQIADGKWCSKQFKEREMDWRRGTRKRAEGTEPDKRLSLTSKFNNSDKGNDVLEGKRRERRPVNRFWWRNSCLSWGKETSRREIGPLSWLWWRWRSTSSTRLEMERGMAPTKWLLSRYNWCKRDKEPISEGRGPVNRLRERDRPSNLDKRPIWEGMAPVSWFLWRCRLPNREREQSSEGMAPVNRFQYRYKLPKKDKEPSSEGMGPVSSFLYKDKTSK